MFLKNPLRRVFFVGENDRLESDKGNHLISIVFTSREKNTHIKNLDELVENLTDINNVVLEGVKSWKFF